jgi:excisionase family DNA binding protein
MYASDNRLTIQEAAEAVGAQKQSLIRAIHRGTLPAVMIGGMWWVDAESVQAWKQRGRYGNRSLRKQLTAGVSAELCTP